MGRPVLHQHRQWHRHIDTCTNTLPGGAAVIIESRAVSFSPTSLPTVWKTSFFTQVDARSSKPNVHVYFYNAGIRPGHLAVCVVSVAVISDGVFRRSFAVKKVGLVVLNTANLIVAILIVCAVTFHSHLPTRVGTLRSHNQQPPLPNAGIVSCDSKHPQQNS